MKKLIDDKNPDYVLGCSDMDATHMEFIELVNALGEADAETFKSLFARLLSHTEKHFDSENQWMEESHFPAKGEHMAEHARVINDLKQFSVRVQRGSTGMAQAFVKEQIPEWFKLHASTMDAALAKHLEGSKQ